MTGEVHDLSALIAQVHHMEDVEAAATALIQGLSAKYAEALRLSDWAAVSTITETLRLSAGNLSAAVTANTVVGGVAPTTVVVIDHAAQAAAVDARVAADAARAALDIQPVVNPDAAVAPVVIPVVVPAQEVAPVTGDPAHVEAPAFVGVAEPLFVTSSAPAPASAAATSPAPVEALAPVVPAV